MCRHECVVTVTASLCCHHECVVTVSASLCCHHDCVVNVSASLCCRHECVVTVTASLCCHCECVVYGCCIRVEVTHSLFTKRRGALIHIVKNNIPLIKNPNESLSLVSHMYMYLNGSVSMSNSYIHVSLCQLCVHLPQYIII